ncbi:MAG: FHA domain-containing protein, partial [Planctomycetota bacterium]
MGVEVVKRDDVREVLLWQQFRTDVAGDLAKVLEELIDEPGRPKILINVESLSNFSSSVLEVLTSAADRLGREGRRLTLAGVTPLARAVLQATRLDSRFDLTERVLVPTAAKEAAKEPESTFADGGIGDLIGVSPPAPPAVELVELTLEEEEALGLAPPGSSGRIPAPRPPESAQSEPATPAQPPASVPPAASAPPAAPARRVKPSGPSRWSAERPNPADRMPDPSLWKGSVLALQGLAGPKSVQDRLLVLEGKETVIGRGVRADLQVVRRALSRRHARVVWRAGCPFVIDQKSSNGTMLAGCPVKVPCPLVPGDVLEMADVEFEVLALKSDDPAVKDGLEAARALRPDPARANEPVVGDITRTMIRPALRPGDFGAAPGPAPIAEVREDAPWAL